MNRRTIIAAAAAAIMATATAQINSPSAPGYLERARLMLADDNYGGCLDQLQRASQLPMTADEAETAQYLRAAATVHTDKTLAAQMLEQFLAEHPASPMRQQALMAMADCYYGSGLWTADPKARWQDALDIYQMVDADQLEPAQACDLRYRMAVCQLMLGRYDKAEALLATLDGKRGYVDASRFYRGYIAYAQGDYRTAMALLDAARSNTAPGNMADYYLAQMYYQRGDYQRAAATAKQLLQRQGIAPEFVAEAYRIAGESDYRLGQSGAVGLLQKYAGMARGPLAPSTMYILGLDAYRMGDYAKAVDMLRQATGEGDDMSQSAYLYIGQALLKQADVDGAILAFDKALSMDFDPLVQETAYYNYAVASLQGGKVPFGNSLATFENFLRRYPESQYAPQAQEYIVAAYINDKNYAQALASINAMRHPTPETLAAKQRALYMLGTQALATGAAGQAAEYLTEARKIKSADKALAAEAALVLGEAQYRLGDYAQAAALAQEYIQQSPATAANLPLAYYDLGYARFAQKRYGDAAADFKRMLARPGDLGTGIVADAYNRLGDSHYYRKDFAEAAEAYDKSLQINPVAGDYPLLQKAMMEGYQRRHSNKIMLLEQLQSDYPTSALIPDAMLEMTESHIQLGDNEGAIDVYKQLVERYPATPQGRQGYLQMALTMLNAGKKADAIEAYKQVIVRYPSSDEARQASDQLKRVYANDGRLAEYISFINSTPDAPGIDADEAEALTFEVAEKDYITAQQTAKLLAYLADYPEGAHRAKALSYALESAQAAGNDSQAYAYATEIVEKYPDSSLCISALTAKARIEEAQGKGNLALRTWQQLEQRASGATTLNTARLGILRTSMAAADYPLAQSTAAALLASASLGADDRVGVLYLQGNAMAAQGDVNAACDSWSQAAAHPAHEKGIASAYSLAQSHFDAADYAEAERLAKAVTDADTPHAYWVARAFILLSDVYKAQGNEFKSQQYLKSLRANYPGSEADIFQMIDQRLQP